LRGRRGYGRSPNLICCLMSAEWTAPSRPVSKRGSTSFDRSSRGSFLPVKPNVLAYRTVDRQSRVIAAQRTKQAPERLLCSTERASQKQSYLEKLSLASFAASRRSVSTFWRSGYSRARLDIEMILRVILNPGRMADATGLYMPIDAEFRPFASAGRNPLGSNQLNPTNNKNPQTFCRGVFQGSLVPGLPA
jgi:hypothetical protein